MPDDVDGEERSFKSTADELDALFAQRRREPIFNSSAGQEAPQEEMRRGVSRVDMRQKAKWRNAIAASPNRVVAPRGPDRCDGRRGNADGEKGGRVLRGKASRMSYGR